MLIIFGTMAMTLLAAAISFFIPKTYRSEGFFQLGNPERFATENKDAAMAEIKEKVLANKNFVGIPIPFYNSSSPQFSNPNRLQLYASQQKVFTAKDMKNIRENFRTAASINKWIKPVYAFTKENIREFAQRGKDEVNSVIGVSLSYKADSPHDARKYVWFFGNYIRDCLLYITLYNFVMDRNLTIKSELDQIENDFIEGQFDMQQNYQKLFDIKAILAKYPESAKLENWQLVSVQEGGFRFPSPVTQLVTLESALAALRRDLSRLEREKEMSLLDQEYFSRCHDESKKVNALGAELFALLKSIKSEVFKNKDFSKDTVKEAVNKLSIDLQTYDLVFFTNCRFISGPTLPMRYISPRKSVIVIVAFFNYAIFFFFMGKII
jgi:LPS O-antigen subunit length determinant protein (WzzB/FepE family)